MQEYTLLIEKDEDGFFVGSIVELPGCFSQGKSIEELLVNIKEALELYLEVETTGTKNEFVGIQRIQV